MKTPRDPNQPTLAPRGRGAATSPRNRFERRDVEPDPDALDQQIAELEDGEQPSVATQVLRDGTRTILAHNDSPDLGFDTSINPYRGCEHGCAYCYSRPTHEYLGFSAGLDFETKILVKEDAPALLRRELESPRYEPRVIAMSGVTDPYQPLERRLRITRGCLEVLAEKRNPVVIVTKNRLVARDADLLAELARHGAAHVMVSVTTLDDELARRMEPRTSSPRNRLAAISELRAAGVPCGVLAAPVIPALNDHEIPHILEAAKEAGAVNASWVLLRLPHGVKELFDEWLARHYPERRDKVLGRLRETRDGALYRSEFFRRQRGSGAYAEQIAALFELHRKRLGLGKRSDGLSVAAFRRGAGEQLSLL
ncbi:MAG TPA: PA0069 family radical SAM protein [Thermoanaerobaculia bacterium]|nr:PA0069 family radical SAM protein [Thermoanaerobaculia bacterium]